MVMLFTESHLRVRFKSKTSFTTLLLDLPPMLPMKHSTALYSPLSAGHLYTVDAECTILIYKFLLGLFPHTCLFYCKQLPHFTKADLSDSFNQRPPETETNCRKPWKWTLISIPVFKSKLMDIFKDSCTCYIGYSPCPVVLICLSYRCHVLIPLFSVCLNYWQYYVLGLSARPLL